MRRILLLLAVAVTAGAARAEQPAESLSRFHGSVTLTLPNGAVVAGPVLSEDLPTPGYRNRWRYVVGPRVAAGLKEAMGRTQLYAEVRVAATTSGTMVHEALGLFSLELAPAAPELAAAFRSHAPGQEIIWQTMTLRPLAEGYAELLTEEPAQ